MGWEIDNNSDSKLKDEIIELVNRWDIGKIGSSVLDAYLFGFVVGEIVYQYKSGKYIPITLEVKPQEWFIFDRENRIRLRKKTNYGYIFSEGELLSDLKFVLVQYNPTYVNPYGERLLSKVYWPIFFKRAAIEKWHALSEKFGIPFLTGYYSATATDPEKIELLEAIEEAIENHITIMKEGTQLDFKEYDRYEVGKLFEGMIELQNSEMSKALLTVTLTTEIKGGGSYNAAQTHQEMLEYVGLGDKKLLETALNKMIRNYLYINYGIEDKSNWLKLKRKETIIDSTAERDAILSKMGLKFTKEYFVKRYNLSEEDFEVN
jgi:phage gp29-like protein